MEYWVTDNMAHPFRVTKTTILSQVNIIPKDMLLSDFYGIYYYRFWVAIYCLKHRFYILWQFNGIDFCMQAG